MEKQEPSHRDARHAFRHNAQAERFELDLADDTAYIEYVRLPEVLVLTHTHVPKAYEGRGIGSELVRATLEDIRTQRLRIVPQCVFVARYIERHPEWAEIVFEPETTL